MATSAFKVQEINSLQKETVNTESKAIGEKMEEKEDIWGKDLQNYREEIIQYGNALMLFGGFLVLSASHLTVLWDGKVETIQGAGFLTFVVGLIIMLKPVLKKD